MFLYETMLIQFRSDTGGGAAGPAAKAAATVVKAETTVEKPGGFNQRSQCCACARETPQPVSSERVRKKRQIESV